MRVFGGVLKSARIMRLSFLFFIFVSLSNSSRPPRYLILSPRLIRPNLSFNVAVIILSEHKNVFPIRATVTRNSEQIAAAATDTMDPEISMHLMSLLVPKSSKSGNYMLKIEGGNVGTPIFTNYTKLEFSPDFLSIVVQSSRPIYRAGQEVRFRILILHPDLSPFDDAVEVHLLDPDGLIMKRWLSAYTNNGVASLKFKLPKMTKDGFWKIQVRAWDQIEEKKIKVETYFSPLFEVHVKLQPYTLANEEVITARISGKFTSEKIAKGNTSVTVSGKTVNGNTSDTSILADNFFISTREHELKIPMNLVKDKFLQLEGVELEVNVSITEFLYGETVSGFSRTRIIPSSLHVRFLSRQPAVFRPGMPFYTQIAVSCKDNERVPEDVLLASHLIIKITLHSETGKDTILPEIIAGSSYNNVDFSNENNKNVYFNSFEHSEYLEKGVLAFGFDTNDDTISISLRAVFINEDDNEVTASLDVVRHYSVDGKYLSVWSSTKDGIVGEYAIFHVRTNYRMEFFHYLVVSKGQILYSNEKKIEDPTTLSVTTLAIPLATDMSPGFHLLVFHITQSGVVIVDSCYLPVEGFSQYEMEIEINKGKDLKADRVEIRASGDEGAFIGVHSVRAAAYELQAGNEITKSRIVNSFIDFEPHKRLLHEVKWRTRDGTAPDESTYFPSADYGRDAFETIYLAGLLILTTENVPSDSSAIDECFNSNLLSCLDSGCFTLQQKCDQVSDCADNSDERDCEYNYIVDDYEYKIGRMSRFTFLYDSEDGDWGWREIKKNDHEGIEFEPSWPPREADIWYFNGFTVGKETGFSIVSEPVVFSSEKPFTMHVSGPNTCHRGEQLGIRILLVNNHHLEALVLLQLIGSPDYKFVHVEPGGFVSSYSAKLSDGNHQLLIYLAPESQKHVDFPVAPSIERGDIEIIFLASTQTGKSEVRHKVTVLGEGAQITRHTSEFLDLRTRALSLHYLNIVVEESPLVTYEEWRRYVFGSPYATLTLTGDLIGPTFPEIPVTIETILNQHGKSTETNLFEMAVNTWTLHYLRLTNQLQPAVLLNVLEEINTIYAHVMRRYNAVGSFSNWDSSRPNLWLTAWAVQIFKHATFPDWENVLYIDSKVFASTVSWILNFQTPDGCFVDTYLPGSNDIRAAGNNSDISLTAHVLIALMEAINSGVISGEVRGLAVSSAREAAYFLERQLNGITDSYLIAISAQALTLTGSSYKGLAFEKLQNASRRSYDGLVYWSNKEMPSNPFKLENQRPFRQPRLYYETESVAVEATSWALLVNLNKDGVTDYTEKIVKWLTTMRMTTSGFISTVDTVVALQALTEYAFRARLLDITNITVAIEMSNIAFKKYIHIGNSSFSQPSILEVPIVWGHINLVARGAGQALAQLNVNFGVDYEPLKDHPSKPSFDLKIKEYYLDYRNKSAITIESCFRWLREWPYTSGAAALEIQIPTGYNLVESEAENIVQKSGHPTIRDGKTMEGKTIWFFEYIEQSWSCFNHTVRRWYPVANMTLYRQAIIYEVAARERFEQAIFNSTPLYILNICEVCGSYQCPYCPFYNGSNRLTINLFLIVLLVYGILYTKLL